MQYGVRPPSMALTGHEGSFSGTVGATETGRCTASASCGRRAADQGRAGPHVRSAQRQGATLLISSRVMMALLPGRLPSTRHICLRLLHQRSHGHALCSSLYTVAPQPAHQVLAIYDATICLLFAPQTTSKADPKAISAHGVAAAMAADSSRPLDILIIANRLEKGAV